MGEIIAEEIAQASAAKIFFSFRLSFDCLLGGLGNHDFSAGAGVGNWRQTLTLPRNG
jgi:hypothetical protein